uniref:Uncharacterized protein n=1 Tax=Micrurus lemniscatus lemniscatus TaxID=129467 RepID=A0A2D4IMT8_MICLE
MLSHLTLKAIAFPSRRLLSSFACLPALCWDHCCGPVSSPTVWGLCPSLLPCWSVGSWWAAPFQQSQPAISQEGSPCSVQPAPHKEVPLLMPPHTKEKEVQREGERPGL